MYAVASATLLLMQGLPLNPGCRRGMGRQVWRQEGAQFWGDLVVHGNRLDPPSRQLGAASVTGHASLHGSGGRRGYASHEQPAVQVHTCD